EPEAAHIADKAANKKGKQLTPVIASLQNIKSVIQNSVQTDESEVDAAHNRDKTRIAYKIEEIAKFLTFGSQIKIGNDVFDVILITDKLKNDINPNRSYLYEIYANKQAPYSTIDAPWGLSGDNITDNPKDVKDFTGDPDYVYRRAAVNNPMASVDLAMFADDDDMVRNYGDYVFRAKISDLTPIEDVLPSIIEAALEDDNGIFEGMSEEEIGSAFAPQEIVNSADAYDNSEARNFIINWAQDNDIKGVKTPDGAIVFDAGLIEAQDTNIQEVKRRMLFYQSATNGYYDPELETIVLGKSTNSGTLPHEFAHFWLEQVFDITHDGRLVNDRARAVFDPLFEMLGVGEGQTMLTEEQQEHFATMTEAYIFGLSPLPKGSEYAFTEFQRFIAPKYESLLSIGYRDRYLREQGSCAGDSAARNNAIDAMIKEAEIKFGCCITGDLNSRIGIDAFFLVFCFY
ncbi:MAG: hypothetical protein LBB08_02445, partial [Rickettsiales bacterium]|nr:hypothetical protein [Rickettsiales bacterium]